MKKLLLFLALALGCAAQTILPTTALFGGQVTPAAPSGGAGVFSSVTDTGLTSGRLVLVGTGGLLQDSANFTYVDGTTTGQLIHPVGAVGTPSVTFLGRTTNGLYSPAANTVDMAINGAVNARFVTTHLLLGGLTTDGTGVLQFPAATTSAGGITFGTDTNLFRANADGGLTLTTASTTWVQNWNTTVTGSTDATIWNIQRSASNKWALNILGTSNNFSLYNYGTSAVALSIASATSAVTVANKISSYNGITTAGQGVPIIVAAGRVTAQSAANASISTYTVGAPDGSFEVSANMNVTAATSLVTTMTCTYTDESNTSRTMIFPVTQLNGSFIALGAVTGTGAWETPTMHIRCKAATAITILTSAGTFTGVTYTAEGIIRQLN